MIDRIGRRAKALLLCASVALAPAMGCAESLADAFVKTYRASPQLEQQRLLQRTLDEDVAVALSALRPTVAGQAAISRNLVRNFPNNTAATLQLVLDYTLLDGGQRRMRLGAAKEAVLSGRYQLIQSEQNLLLQAADAYFGLQLAQRNVSLRESNLRLLTEQLRAARDRFEVGEVTRTDVTIAEARLAAAQSLLANARGQVDIQREAYRAVTGTLPQGPLEPPPPLPQLPPTVERAQALALQVHPLILSGQHDIAAATLLASAAEAERLPTIGLQGSIGASRAAQGEPSANLGIQSNVPIYNGGRLSALNRRAIANAQASRAALEQQARLIANGVGQAYALLEIARAQILASQQQVRSAQLAFEGFREEAALGARTTLDVLDAEQELLDARTSALNAEIDAQIAVYQVLAAIGLMTTEHLGLTVERYDPSDYYNLVADAPAVSPSSQGGRLDRVLRRFGRD